MARTPTPMFTHDCKRCRYLGTIHFDSEWGDLYACDNSRERNHHSLIFRFGDEGRDYTSAPVVDVIHLRTDHPLRVALTLYNS